MVFERKSILDARTKLLSITLVVSCCTGISAVLNLVLVRLLTGSLAPIELAVVTLAMTMTVMVSQTINGPFGASITRFVAPAIDEGQSKHFLLVCFGIAAISLLGIFIIGVGASCVYALIFKSETWMTVQLSTIFVACNFIFTILSSFLFGRNKQFQFGVFQLIDVGGKVLVVLILIRNTPELNGNLVIAGYIIATAVTICFQLFFTILDPVNKAEHSRWKEVPLERKEIKRWKIKIFQYSYPYVIWGIGSGLYMVSDRWLLSVLGHPQQVAFVGILFQIGFLPMSLIAGVFAQVLTPFAFKMAGLEGKNRQILKVNKIIFQLSCCGALLFFSCAIFVYFNSNWIVRWFVGSEYFEIHSLLFVYVLAGGVFGIGQIVAISLQSANRSLDLLKAKLPTFILGLCLNAILIPAFGLVGASIAILMYSLSSTLLTLWYVKHQRF